MVHVDAPFCLTLIARTSVQVKYLTVVTAVTYLKYNLKIYIFDLSLNLPYITIYLTTLLHLLMIF